MLFENFRLARVLVESPPRTLALCYCAFKAKSSWGMDTPGETRICFHVHISHQCMHCMCLILRCKIHHWFNNSLSREKQRRKKPNKLNIHIDYRVHSNFRNAKRWKRVVLKSWKFNPYNFDVVYMIETVSSTHTTYSSESLSIWKPWRTSHFFKSWLQNKSNPWFDL